MSDNFDAMLAEGRDGIFKHGKIIASSDKACGAFMDGLKSKFDPYRLYSVQFVKETLYFIVYTVGPCGNGQYMDIRMVYGRREDFS